MTPANERFTLALRSIESDDDDLQAKLYDLIDTIPPEEKKEEFVSTMFAFFERFPDSDHGSPGPFVHFIEAWVGYETELELSVRRKPTPHTVWMINRVLNAPSSSSQRERWMDLLRSVESHPNSTELTIFEAKKFLTHQNEKG
jgi:hypothetical protein